MLNRDDQKLLDHNVQRAGTFDALRKINRFVQEDEKGKQIETTVTKIILGVIAVMGMAALSVYFIGRGRPVTKPHPEIIISSERFTEYDEAWAKQVNVKLANKCIDLKGTAGESTRAVISTSILKDGTVEKIEVTKTSGNKEFDAAAVQAVLAAAPFKPFSAEIQQDTDIITITRSFLRGECKQ